MYVDIIYKITATQMWEGIDKYCGKSSTDHSNS